MMIAQKLGAEKMWQYFEDYGLFDKTGIDLGGEGSSIFWSKEEYTSANGLSSLAVSSFGQTFKVTPIRMITSFASVVNGGHLITPYLVDKISDDDGNTLYYHETEEVRQVLSESTSEKLREILESVVANGTGGNAYMAGYRIGGKTGTSEKRDEDTDDVIVSFMGVAPADNPQVLVLIAFDSPKRASANSNYTASGVYISGGNMAAPIAGQLIANILDSMGVEKQYTTEELSGTDTVVPSLAGYDLTTAQKSLSNKGFSYRTVGSGSTVTGQVPSGGVSIPGGSTVILYMGEEVPTDQVEVPDVTGMTPAKVKETLEAKGLFLRATGVSGDYNSSVYASTQAIDAGTSVARGTVIEVRFVSSVIDYAYNT
jgi:stage V sporulation protein D (sporulation-specific penicillin-binding protein)